MADDNDNNAGDFSPEDQMALIDGSPIVVYTSRPDGDFGATFISKGIREQLGWEPRDFLENSEFWASLIHPDDQQFVFAEMPKLFEHDRHSIEYRFRHKDGSYLWMNDELRLERDKNGKPLRIIGYWADITARKRAELANRHLAAVVENSADAILTFDLEGLITSWNVGAENAYGYSAAEAIGSSIVLILPEDNAAETLASLKQGAESLPVMRFEAVRRRKDGTLVDVLVTNSPIKDGMGETVEISAIHRDITERKQAEDALRESEERNFDLLMGSNIGIQIGASDGSRRFANPACAEMFGYGSVDELMSLPAYGLIGEPDRDRIIKYTMDLNLGVVDSLTYEYDGLKKDGTVIPVEVFGRPIFWNGEYAIQRSFTDLTDRKHAEEQLRQAQKMDAIGQLTGGIAHEFNNLLMVIHGNLELAMMSNLDDRAQKSVASAKAGAMRGAELTGQLLAFSRKQSLKVVELDLNELVGDMHEMLQRTLGEMVSVETHFDADVWPVHADAALLESTLLNLALNARDAMPRGGEIRIATSNRLIDAGMLADHPNVVPGAYIMLQVSDTGTGMTPEILEHALEPFFTTKDVGEGTGLGLSMIHGFAEQSGGFLDIESEPGRGTLVRLYLPRGDADGEAVVEAGTQTKLSPPSQLGATVLMVEDDPDVREIVAQSLLKLGCAVIEAADGAAALSHLSENPDIDVLFTDVVLPGGIAGPEIAREARRRLPDLKVILTSGYPDGDGEFNEMALSGEPSWFIRKPYRISELAELLDRVLKS